MQVRLICPAPPRSRSGNRITALRWARVLRGLGHSVSIAGGFAGEPCDVMVALHARRSAGAVFRYRERHDGKSLLIALTGTDLYGDLGQSREAQRALELADRLIALQPLAACRLAPELRQKLRVIYQSVSATPGPAGRSERWFDVCVAGHLRAVKDPFRAALAARALPAGSRVRIWHAGAALDPGMAERAEREERRNPRYRWLGELPRWRLRRLIARCHLLVLSSRMEGGANVISEAVVDGTPVLASEIDGSVGLLGADYPGYFAVGDTADLRRLIERAQGDPGFYEKLRAGCRRAAPLFEPRRERRAWKALLSELQPSRSRPRPNPGP